MPVAGMTVLPRTPLPNAGFVDGVNYLKKTDKAILQGLSWLLHASRIQTT